MKHCVTDFIIRTIDPRYINHSLITADSKDQYLQLFKALFYFEETCQFHFIHLFQNTLSFNFCKILKGFLFYYVCFLRIYVDRKKITVCNHESTINSINVLTMIKTCIKFKRSHHSALYKYIRHCYQTWFITQD